MFKRRKKRAPYRVCDYPDCLETATEVWGGTHDDGLTFAHFACKEHVDAVNRIVRLDPVRGRYETRGGAA